MSLGIVTLRYIEILLDVVCQAQSLFLCCVLRSPLCSLNVSNPGGTIQFMNYFLVLVYLLNVVSFITN